MATTFSATGKARTGNNGRHLGLALLVIATAQLMVVRAGVSMAFSEGLSDTGDLTGRGRPFQRGAITAPHWVRSDDCQSDDRL
jgi:hypothetical protein